MEGFSVKALNTGERLDVQIGPEGQILQYPIGSRFEEVCKFSVEGDFLGVHVFVFWTRPSTTGVYKVIENPSLTPEKNQHQSHDIFGQYVDFDSHGTRSPEFWALK